MLKVKSKGKVTVLSPHTGSELCSADFDKYPSLVIGPLQSIYSSGYPSQPPPPGEYTATHTQLCATAYRSALTGTYLLQGREKQCSVKCLAQGHNERTYWQVIEPGT